MRLRAFTMFTKVAAIHSTNELIHNKLQRDDIFYTRCFINNNVCSMMIDSECTNVVSTNLVEKLELPLFKHPKPYKLYWFNDCGEINVRHQRLVTFSIGKFSDEVLCDVVPMHTTHLLLGRPW